MFFELTNNVSGLKSLEKTYSNGDLVNKVFRSLSKATKSHRCTRSEWLKTIAPNHLLGSLITDDMIIGEDQAKRRNALYFKPQGKANMNLIVENKVYPLENSSASSTGK